MTTSISSRRIGPFNVGRVLGITMALAFPVAQFAPKGLAPLFVAAALLVIGLTFDRYRTLSVLPQPVSSAIGIFVVFAAISAFWSVTPGETLYSVLVLALTCIGGLAIAVAASKLTDEERKFFEKATIYGGSIGLALILFEQASNRFLNQSLVELIIGEGPPPGLSPGIAAYALFIWPWMVAIKRQFGNFAMTLALTVSFFAIVLSRSNSPALALGLGLVVAAAAMFSGRLMATLFATILVVGIAVTPFLPGALPNPETETKRLSFLSPSALHRLSIWNTAVRRMKEVPLLGIGLNATRSLYNDKDRIRREYFTSEPIRKWYNFYEPIPLHVHNGILQIWLELGIGGALMLGAIMLSLVRLVRSNFKYQFWTAACLGLLTSAVIIFSLSFGPWQSWWQATLWLSAGFIVAMRNTETADNPR